MTKKLFILTLLIFTFHLGQSQVLISLIFGDKLNSDKIEFGLDVGANYSTMSGFESGRSLPSFNLGFYFDFLISTEQLKPLQNLTKIKKHRFKKRCFVDLQGFEP